MKPICALGAAQERASLDRRALVTDRLPVAAPPDVGPVLVLACFIAFVLVWTLYGTIANAGMSLHGDVAEAYSWGREFRLGYNQHPPFWAWIAGLWFGIFPTRAWAFNLLAVLNAAVGLLGCWRLIGLFAADWERLAAFVLLLSTPFYTFLCYRYNANSIFLSIWPWTLYFLLTSINTRDRSQAVCFGVLLAAGLLSKYYAATLDITCLAASLVHPRGRDYWRSACPAISIAVCCTLVLPHLVWLLRDDAPPVVYIWGRTGLGLTRAVIYSLRFLASVTLYHALALVLLVSVMRAGAAGVRAPRQWRDPLLVVLVVAPILLTALFGLLFELKISSNMTIGIFPLLPLLLMRVVPRFDARLLFRRAGLPTGAIAVAALLASPAIAYVTFRTSPDPEATEPRQELAVLVTRLWHEEIGTRLRYVAGSDPYENAIGFYSIDHPAVFLSFDQHKAPWVNAAALKTAGMVAVCVHGDAACERAAAPLLTSSSRMFAVTLRHVFWGSFRAPVSFDIHLVPPQGSGS